MTTANMTTNITVRDLTDARILRAVITKAGYDLYEEAVAEHGAASVNLNLYRRAMQVKHPGITLAEVEDSLAKASPDQVMEMVDFANGLSYNHLMVVSVPNDKGGQTPMAVLSKDESVSTDSADNVERIIEGFGENAITDEDTGKTTLILDLPVVVFKQEGDALKPVQIKADIGKLVKEIQRKQR